MRHAVDDGDPGRRGTGNPARQASEDQRQVHPSGAKPTVGVEKDVDTFVGPQRTRIEQVRPDSWHEVGPRGGPRVGRKNK